jgi:MFS family permease
MVAGGAAIDWVGWRATFLIIGLPGIVLAIAVRMIIVEPRAVAGAKAGASGPQVPVRQEPFRRVVKAIFSLGPARHVLIGMMLATLFTSPSLTFLAPYIIRSFGLSYSQVGVVIGGAQMGGMVLATISAGLLADRLGRRDPRWYFWVPAGSMLLGGPLLMLAFSQPNWQLLMLLMFFASLVSAAYLAPSYAVLYAAVQPHWRATTAAIAGAMMSMGGSSVGPLVCGAMIDWLTPVLFEQAQRASFAATCAGGSTSTGAADLTIAACRAAIARSTQLSLIILSLFCLWPAFHFIHAARLWKRHGGADFGH